MEGIQDRFVLAVTCDVKSNKAHERLREEAERFRSHQIEYEPWFLGRLVEKLEPHRNLVARYYEMSTVEWICGTPQAVPYSATVQISKLTQELDQSIERLSDAEIARLSELKRKWHAGKAQEVRNQLDAALARLDLLPEDVQRDYLRFAVHVVSSHDPGRARALLEQLASLAPDATQATRAILELNQGNFELALASVIGSDSLDAMSVRALVLLHTEKNDEAIALLEALRQPSIETDRILALSYLVTRRLDAAEGLLRKRLAEEPTRESLRLALAKVLFYKALSPVSWPSSIWEFLAPVEPALVKSQPGDLAKAKEVIQTLQDIVESSQNSQSVLEAKQWLFASLCLFPSGNARDVARKFEEELKQTEPDSLILNWAITYLEVLDDEVLEHRLRILAGPEHSDLQYTVALVNLQLRRGEAHKACEILEEQLVRLGDGRGQSQLKVWLARAYMAAGRRDEAFQLAQGNQDVAEVLLFPDDAESSMEKAAVTLYERYQSTGNLESLLGAARLKSSLRDWPWLEQLGDQLLTEIQTSEALSIATAAAFNLGNYQRCLELLEQADILAIEFLPRKVYAMLALGRLKEAGEAVAQFAATDSDMEALRCQLVYSHASGHTEDLSNLAKRFLASPEATGSDFFRLAFSMRTVNHDQARLLLERALKLGIEDDLVVGALQFAPELGLTDDRYVKPLIDRMVALADAGRPNIQKVSVEDF